MGLDVSRNSDRNATTEEYMDGLAQDLNNSGVVAMELLQSCAKP